MRIHVRASLRLALTAAALAAATSAQAYTQIVAFGDEVAIPEGAVLIVEEHHQLVAQRGLDLLEDVGGVVGGDQRRPHGVHEWCEALVRSNEQEIGGFEVGEARIIKAQLVAAEIDDQVLAAICCARMLASSSGVQ